MMFNLVLLCLLLALCAAGTVALEPLRIDGLVAATFAAFDEHGALNESAVPEQAAYLNNTGVQAVFVDGTTGESLKLSLEERKAHMEAWIKAAKPFDMIVIVHVGAESLVDAKALAMHAADKGADAIGAMPPTFFRPATVSSLARWVSAIAEAAPKLPTYYYHIPSMTNVVFPMFDLVKEMEANGAANFVGVKYTGLYTSPGFMDATKIFRYKQGKYELLSGRDEMMVEALAVGIKGFVGSQYNYAGDIYNGVRAAWARNDQKGANALLAAAVDIVTIGGEMTKSNADVNPWKGIMNIVLDGAVGPPRLPNIDMTSAEQSSLKASLRSWCGVNSATWKLLGNRGLPMMCNSISSSA